ncbi:MAG: NADH-quinone oxidoreductase subunit J [Candidatus Symbiobacter sp.]|nr:NADH-quinone oxidoreductase subunit J [Candidatus Symbiobacter sp.]
MILEGLAFYLFALLAIAAGAMVVTARNPVHSVLFLILTFFNAAGLFVLLHAEFLAMILVIVYVGAVAVLFLFVVMMLDINFRELRQGARNYARIGLAVGLVLLVELALVGGMYGHNFSYTQSNNNITVSPTPENNESLASDEPEAKLAGDEAALPPGNDATSQGTTQGTPQGTSKSTADENNPENLPLDSETAEDEPNGGGFNASGQNGFSTEVGDRISASINNTEAIGRVLYTKYFLMFQLAGLVLLVAMIGAITLTLRQRGGVRRQVISEQLARHPANSVHLVKVTPYDPLKESTKK